MNTPQVLGVALTTFALGTLVGAAVPREAGVVSLKAAPARVAPSGKATVRTLSKPGAQAFIGMLELSAGATVPLHRDESDEFVYVLEGGGTLTMDGVAYTIGPGDLVTMPGGAEVQFAASPRAPTRVLQVFAPGTSAEKYAAWPDAQP